MLRKTGLSSSLARRNAASPQGYQSYLLVFSYESYLLVFSYESYLLVFSNETYLLVFSNETYLLVLYSRKAAKQEILPQPFFFWLGNEGVSLFVNASQKFQENNECSILGDHQ